MSYHNPVLLNECIQGLNIKENGVYVDVTFGGGGHSKEILNQLGPDGKLFGFDQDKDAQQNSIKDNRFVLIPENFRYISRFLRFHQVKKVDGILADLGVSSFQFDSPERGFSTRFDAELDMRMNQSDQLSAKDILNTYPEEQLANLFYAYGELRSSRGIASAIVNARKNQLIHSSFELTGVLQKFLPAKRKNKILAQIFQALRIEVNQEMEVLKEFLNQIPDLLNPEGRLCVISYHSLEDRLVKRFIRTGLFEGEPERDMYGNFSVPLKKVGGLITPSADEIKENNRARSAKLRIAIPS
ncbi:MAG: 16S rRNA (cytosine(1402)-N(4))-methyltransferase RsmH [Polaribacter sp.]